MEYILNEFAAIINFVIALIIIITFFVLAYRINGIKKILETSFSDSTPEGLKKLSVKEEFKGNIDKARDYLMEALYYEIKKYMIEFENVKDYQKYKDIENIMKKYTLKMDKYKAPVPEIKDFF